MSPWPTPLDANGRAPAAITLVGSGDALLTRQGVYVVFAGKALKESGCEVETFQQPVAGTHGGVTIPILMKNAQQRRAAVYTSSEAWTPENVAGLAEWIADLRRAGVPENVPVIVVGHADSKDVAALPGVFQFIHLPNANLPSAGKTAATEKTPTPLTAAELAARFLPFVSRNYGITLDYGVPSLRQVDAVIEDLRRDQSLDRIRPVLLWAGCYVGEVLVRHAGGRWRAARDLGMDAVTSAAIVIEMPDGVRCNPVGKVTKLFQNGLEDSVAYFYHVVTEVPLDELGGHGARTTS